MNRNNSVFTTRAGAVHDLNFPSETRGCMQRFKFELFARLPFSAGARRPTQWGESLGGGSSVYRLLRCQTAGTRSLAKRFWDPKFGEMAGHWVKGQERELQTENGVVDGI